MFSVTLTTETTVGGITQSQSANYTSDEPASLDQVGIVCEYICGMVLLYNEGEDDAHE